jgi:hypothetical protein
MENDLMSERLESKTITKKQSVDEAPHEQPSQRRRPEIGPFRLQVDRQTKSSHLTLEAAEQAGLVIKRGHPLVQVTVYDSVKAMSTIIEAPKS